MSGEDPRAGAGGPAPASPPGEGEGGRWSLVDGAGEMLVPGGLGPGVHRFHAAEGLELRVEEGRARVRVGAGEWQELVAGEALPIPPGEDYEIEVEEAADRLLLRRVPAA